MTDNEKHNRVIALRFADGLRVDIAHAMTHFEAIADMTARAMNSAQPPILPLYEAATAIIPADRLLQILPVLDLGDGYRVEHVVEPSAQPVPIGGLKAAMRAYGQRDITGASPDALAAAQAELARFSQHYGITVDFSDGVPDWLKAERAKNDPGIAWTTGS